MDAFVIFRNGCIYDTEIDKNDTPVSLATRMVEKGFVICEDDKWGRHRQIIINLADVSRIILYPDKDNK